MRLVDGTFQIDEEVGFDTTESGVIVKWIWHAIVPYGLWRSGLSKERNVHHERGLGDPCAQYMEVDTIEVEPGTSQGERRIALRIS